MKRLFFSLIVCSIQVYSQESDSTFFKYLWAQTDSLLIKSPEENNKIDFSSVWLAENRKIVHGFIGENYQRLDIIILSAIQSKNNSIEYIITGRSRVKNNICSFKGIATVSQIYIYDKINYALVNEFKDKTKGIKKQGVVIGKYKFNEDSTSNHSGIFEGTFASKWYLDTDYELKYDDTRIVTDDYWNNAFTGTWKSYKENTSKICNWGDHRIYNCGDLDTGTGEFAPNENYLPFGWQTYYDTYIKNDSTARQLEEIKWWEPAK